MPTWTPDRVNKRLAQANAHLVPDSTSASESEEGKTPSAVERMKEILDRLDHQAQDAEKELKHQTREPTDQEITNASPRWDVTAISKRTQWHNIATDSDNSFEELGGGRAKELSWESSEPEWGHSSTRPWRRASLGGACLRSGWLGPGRGRTAQYWG